MDFPAQDLVSFYLGRKKMLKMEPIWILFKYQLFPFFLTGKYVFLYKARDSKEWHLSAVFYFSWGKKTTGDAFAELPVYVSQ